jgi:hypothetical protein
VHFVCTLVRGKKRRFSITNYNLQSMTSENCFHTQYKLSHVSRRTLQLTSCSVVLVLYIYIYITGGLLDLSPSLPPLTGPRTVSEAASISGRGFNSHWTWTRVRIQCYGQGESFNDLHNLSKFALMSCQCTCITYTLAASNKRKIILPRVTSTIIP